MLLSGRSPNSLNTTATSLATLLMDFTTLEVREKLLSSHEPLMGLPQQSPTYAAMVHSLDDAVGSLLDTISMPRALLMKQS